MEDWKHEIIAQDQQVRDLAEYENQKRLKYEEMGKVYNIPGNFREKALTDLIISHGEEIEGMLSKKPGRDSEVFQAYRPWLKAMSAQAEGMEREGRERLYEYEDGFVPNKVVFFLRKDLGISEWGLIKEEDAAVKFAITIKQLRTLSQSGDAPCVKSAKFGILYDWKVINDLRINGGLSRVSQER